MLLFQIPALPLNLKIETYDDLCDSSKYPSTLSFFPLCIPKDIRYVSVLQMMDATRIPKCLSPQYFGPTITVEIKPKQGFMQNHPGVDVPYCNNCILQVLFLIPKRGGGRGPEGHFPYKNHPLERLTMDSPPQECLRTTSKPVVFEAYYPH